MPATTKRPSDDLARRDDATWLAELLMGIETDPDDITRLRLIDGWSGRSDTETPGSQATDRPETNLNPDKPPA